MFGKVLTLIFALLSIASCQFYGGYPTAGGYYGNSIYGGGYQYGGYPNYGYPSQSGYYGGLEYGSPYGYVGKRSSGFGPKN